MCMASQEEQKSPQQVKIQDAPGSPSASPPGSPRMMDKDRKEYKKVGKYVIGDKLGSGAFAQVHVAMDTETNKKVAVKVCNKRIIMQRNMADDLKWEVATLARASKGTHVTKLMDTIETDNNMYLVMELCSGTLLEEVISKGGMPGEEGKQRFIEVLNAVRDLHLARLTHRDIKPENIMISSEGRLKLGDFGFARPTNANGRNSQVPIGAGTPEYLAPECFDEKYRNKAPGAKHPLLCDPEFDFFASDVWSVGVVLYSIVTGRLPYSRSEVQTWASPKAVVRTPYFPPTIDLAVKDLILKMLKRKERRLTLAEVFAHPWITGTSTNTRMQARRHSTPAGPYGCLPTMPTVTPARVNATAVSSPRKGSVCDDISGSFSGTVGYSSPGPSDSNFRSPRSPRSTPSSLSSGDDDESTPKHRLSRIFSNIRGKFKREKSVFKRRVSIFG
ncbi:CBL-interacting serine/threonine-protein kinase 26 [Diplonema papillatum]|nr:CBL-interacting serine/threonine-protein kinase 26 [Diplonema papillatum]